MRVACCSTVVVSAMMFILGGSVIGVVVGRLPDSAIAPYLGVMSCCDATDHFTTQNFITEVSSSVSIAFGTLNGSCAVWGVIYAAGRDAHSILFLFYFLPSCRFPNEKSLFLISQLYVSKHF